MPSVGVKALLLATLAVPALLVAGRVPAAAAPLGTAIPANCTAHTSFDGGPDVPGDYRCAGLVIQYHTGGVAHSPFPIWAGQWLFTDGDGQYRVGYCTLNRGNHPTVAVPSQPVAQTLPNDPGGRRSGYLAWRYGDTTDDLTAAALWAVFHYYAQDAAGGNRAANPLTPLVPRLDGLQARSGRADLQARAIELATEAETYAGEWHLTVDVAADGNVTVSLLAGETPVAGQPITVLVSGSDLPHAATTNTAGTATVAVSMPSGTVTVAATVDVPGAAVAYRGQPAAPDPHGAQLLVTAGAPGMARAVTTLDLPGPTTTEAPTTTEEPPTTMEEPPTTEAPSTTEEPTTTTLEPSTTEPPVPTSPPTSVAATVPPSLPRTGGGGGDRAIAYVGTSFVVGGVGLLGTLRRRVRPTYTR